MLRPVIVREIRNRTIDLASEMLSWRTVSEAPEVRRQGSSPVETHMEVLAAADLFTVEVLTWRGLVTYYILFFIEVGTRRVCLGGITRHPDAGWMEQVARNATMQDSGYLHGCR